MSSAAVPIVLVGVAMAIATTHPPARRSLLHTPSYAPSDLRAGQRRCASPPPLSGLYIAIALYYVPLLLPPCPAHRWVAGLAWLFTLPYRSTWLLRHTSTTIKPGSQ